LRSPAREVKTGLTSVATGVLVFLLWDVLSHAWDPVEQALEQHATRAALGYGAVLAIAVGIGYLGLVAVDARLNRRPPPRGGPGAATLPAVSPPIAIEPSRLALTIATGIGLHNFAEGLAIGNSAAAGELSLAIMLMIGFALHNATEGFGIVAPLAGERPSWGFLGLLGLIGGGPTFLGTLIGQRFTNDVVSIGFLGVAAGSILFVVIELLAVTRKSGLKTIAAWGLYAGLILGFATDAIISAAGG
jgi:ZIP family zinc transporter